MITYVNTVLVSNKNGETLATAADLAGKETKAELKPLVGKFVFMNCDPSAQDVQLSRMFILMMKTQIVLRLALSHLIVFRKLVRTAPLSLSQLSSGLISSTLQTLNL
jgi:hypothetical protein